MAIFIALENLFDILIVSISSGRSVSIDKLFYTLR
jgi:hypothetical protein